MKTAAFLVAVALAMTASAARAMPAQPAATLSGEVLEVLDVESYTYLRLKTKEGETWAAVPTTAVKKGARVSLANTMVMDNFESKSLKRKFDRIVFGAIADPKAPAATQTFAPHGMGAPHGATGPSAAPAPHGAPAAASAPVARVAKASGPDARTVAEIVGGKAGLKGKPVLVRGQVVKFNAGIMGKNWLHLQDGSGTAGAGTNDILVTTQDKAAVGDIVTAKGTVRTDVNFGPGYAYAVLVEDAAVRK